MLVVKEEEGNLQKRNVQEGNQENQGDDVKYIYNFIFTFFRSKYIWKSTAYFFIFS